MQELNNLTLTLNNILSKIMQLSGGISLRSAFDETSVLLESDEVLDQINGELNIEDCHVGDYHYKISKTVNGVKFFVLSK